MKNNYIKIGKFKSRHHKHSVFLNVFDNNDKLSIKIDYKRFDSQQYRTVMAYCLSIREGKNGRKLINFYEINNKSVKVVSPYKLSSYMLINMTPRNPKRGNRSIPKVWIKRLNKQVTFFLQKNGVNTKYMPKDCPFAKILLACYPEYEVIDNEHFHTLPTSAYAKYNLFKRVLGTSGAYSKKLFLEKMTTLPNRSGMRYIEIVRGVRIKYGLDFTQKFLTTAEFGMFYVKWSFIKHHLCHFTPTQFLKCFHGEGVRLLNDIYRMIRSEEIQIDSSQCSSIDQLHDECVREMNSKRKKYRKDIKTHGYSCLLILKPFYESFSKHLSEYELVNPNNKEELIEWSRFMSNCVSSYDYEILNQQLNIIGIMKDGKLVANMSISSSEELTEIGGKYNNRVDEELIAKIRDICAEIGIKDLHTYWH